MAYITRIHIENCRNVKTLDVDLSPNGTKADDETAPDSSNRAKLPFRHLILTGPNGSGKSGVLERLATHLKDVLAVSIREYDLNKERLVALLFQYEEYTERHLASNTQQHLHDLWTSGQIFFAYAPAKRNFYQEKVPGPATLKLDVESVGLTKSRGNHLLQFLVNREFERVSAFADGDRATAERIEQWFKQLWGKIAILMEDNNLNVAYDRQAFTFRFRRSDGYEFDLNTLADGHAAAFALIAEILLRIEAAQRLKKDFTFEPEGIVIVDEIETHLHLSLQEQILPLLTTMFPKVQFIVATHSPAVIASIPNAVVYDLRKQQQFLSSDYQGIPYGVLMTEHFGISSDIDLDSTSKLLRFRSLALQPSRTPDEEREMEELATTLSARSRILATEVWMVKEHLGVSSVQLAGE